MAPFHEVQKRVQVGLDKRLPSLRIVLRCHTLNKDLEATIKESLHFHPPTPLGVAHRLREERGLKDVRRDQITTYNNVDAQLLSQPGLGSGPGAGRPVADCPRQLCSALKPALKPATESATVTRGGYSTF